MQYLHWQEKTIADFSEKNITDLYNAGFVFTRIGKGVMHQTRSVRIDLSKFEPTSENRRILKKIDTVVLNCHELPMADYDFKVGKLAKDFYGNKFGVGIMSVQKIKEMLTSPEKSNFNCLLGYTDQDLGRVGYTICYMNKEILHYSYPFYDLTAPKDTGLGMMISAIQHAKKEGLKYIYLGSLQRPNDTYKLQFTGLEWFDGEKWQTDLGEVKKILADV